MGRGRQCPELHGPPLCDGRAGRLGLSQLKRRQYAAELKDYRLDEHLVIGLLFLMEVMPSLGAREAYLLRAAPCPTIAYSDASWPEDGQSIDDRPPRLGWVVIRPGQRPVGFTILLGSEFLQLVLERKTQIYAAEAIAPLAAALLTPQLLQGDVVWFCDNEAAVSSLIRGGSRAEDVGALAAAANLRAAELGIRIWFEWVDTTSNPADGLSRDGVRDAWTRAQGWQVQEVPEVDLAVISAYLASPPASTFWPARLAAPASACAAE